MAQLVREQSFGCVTVDYRGSNDRRRPNVSVSRKSKFSDIVEFSVDMIFKTIFFLFKHFSNIKKRERERDNPNN